LPEHSSGSQRKKRHASNYSFELKGDVLTTKRVRMLASPCGPNCFSVASLVSRKASESAVLTVSFAGPYAGLRPLIWGGTSGLYATIIIKQCLLTQTAGQRLRTGRTN